MKTWLLLIFSVCLRLSASGQEDSLFNKEFIFNTFGFIGMHKIGSVSKTPEYKMGEKWKPIDYYKKWAWEQKSNFLFVSESNDTAWMTISGFVEKLNEKKTIFYADKFMKKALKYTPEQFAKIMQALPWIGMDEEALKLSYGEPDDVNTTITANTTSKQYVYGSPGRLYFYFTNGKLTTIQD